MKVLIHACPKRMWYVEGFLLPELKRQGANEVEVWNDTEGKGNLRACMEAFAARGTGDPSSAPSGHLPPGEGKTGDEGTWHIQDDVLLCRDFVERCRQHDEGVVYGFCNEAFTDDPLQTGRVSVEDAWHSFQCVRIPDKPARGRAKRFFGGEWRSEEQPEEEIPASDGRGGDCSSLQAP